MEKYVIMRDGYFLMKGADITFRDISWAGHRNLAQTFTLEEANEMKKRFDTYTTVEIVPYSNTTIFGKKDMKNDFYPEYMLGMEECTRRMDRI